MKTMLSKQEMKIVKIIQGDLPLDRRLFKDVGRLTGLTEEEIIKSITDLMEKGIIRKFGAIIRHQKAGYRENAMVVWAVPPDQCEKAGITLSSFSEITHCYERTPPFEGKYSVFTMVHFRTGENDAVMQKLSDAVGIKDFKVLTSDEEFKKSSMEYF